MKRVEEIEFEIKEIDRQIELLRKRKKELQSDILVIKKTLQSDSHQYFSIEIPKWESNMFPWGSEVDNIAKQIFGFSSLRLSQLEIINATIYGKDVFGVMKTGGGKSLCYQLPSFLPGAGLTLVICPLISLIRDQVFSINKIYHRTQQQSFHGIAASLSSSQNQSDQRSIYCRMLNINKNSQLHGPSSSLSSTSTTSESLRLLFVTPEKIAKSKLLLSHLQQLYDSQRLSRIVVDEAHCASQWGHDFRPDYSKLGVLRTVFPSTPILALTATANKQVREDVIRILGLGKGQPPPSASVSSASSSRDYFESIDLEEEEEFHEEMMLRCKSSSSPSSSSSSSSLSSSSIKNRNTIPHLSYPFGSRPIIPGSCEVFLGDFNRSNLLFQVWRKPFSFEEGVKIVSEIIKKKTIEILSLKWKQNKSIQEKEKEMKNVMIFPSRPSAIVYCFSQKETEQVSQALSEQGILSSPYHAGMSDQDRERAQDHWQENKIQVIVATIAFGLGINKPDVRVVIHFTLSKSLELYYQEAGRAGRDGLPALCLLLYSPSDALRVASLNVQDVERIKIKKNIDSFSTTFSKQTSHFSQSVNSSSSSRSSGSSSSSRVGHGYLWGRRTRSKVFSLVEYCQSRSSSSYSSYSSFADSSSLSIDPSTSSSSSISIFSSRSSSISSSSSSSSSLMKIQETKVNNNNNNNNNSNNTSDSFGCRRIVMSKCLEQEEGEGEKTTTNEKITISCHEFCDICQGEKFCLELFVSSSNSSSSSSPSSFASLSFTPSSPLSSSSFASLCFGYSIFWISGIEIVEAIRQLINPSYSSSSRSSSSSISTSSFSSVDVNESSKKRKKNSNQIDSQQQGGGGGGGGGETEGLFEKKERKHSKKHGSGSSSSSTTNEEGRWTMKKICSSSPLKLIVKRIKEEAKELQKIITAASSLSILPKKKKNSSSSSTSSSSLSSTSTSTSSLSSSPSPSSYSFHFLEPIYSFFLTTINSTFSSTSSPSSSSSSSSSSTDSSVFIPLILSYLSTLLLPSSSSFSMIESLFEWVIAEMLLTEELILHFQFTSYTTLCYLQPGVNFGHPENSYWWEEKEIERFNVIQRSNKYTSSSSSSSASCHYLIPLLPNYYSSPSTSPIPTASSTSSFHFQTEPSSSSSHLNFTSSSPPSFNLTPTSSSSSSTSTSRDVDQSNSSFSKIKRENDAHKKVKKHQFKIQLQNDDEEEDEEDEDMNEEEEEEEFEGIEREVEKEELDQEQEEQWEAYEESEWEKEPENLFNNSHVHDNNVDNQWWSTGNDEEEEFNEEFTSLKNSSSISSDPLLDYKRTPSLSSPRSTSTTSVSSSKVSPSLSSSSSSLEFVDLT